MAAPLHELSGWNLCVGGSQETGGRGLISVL